MSSAGFRALKWPHLGLLSQRLVAPLGSAGGTYVLHSWVRALSIDLHWVSSAIETSTMVGRIFEAKNSVYCDALRSGWRSQYDSVMVVTANIARKLAVNSHSRSCSWLFFTAIHRVLLAFQVIDDEIIHIKDLHPSGLPPAEHFWCLEVLKSLIDACYEDLMIRSLEVVTPLLHVLNNGQQLQIVCVVVLFGTWAYSRVEVDLAENSETVVLVENPGYGKAASIALQNNLLCLIEMVADICISEVPFKLLKWKFGTPSPFPFELFRCPGSLCHLWQVWYRSCYRCVLPAKPPVEDREMKKLLHVLNRLQSWPVLDRWYIVWPHANPIRANYTPEEADFWDHNMALLEFGVMVNF